MSNSDSFDNFEWWSKVLSVENPSNSKWWVTFTKLLPDFYRWSDLTYQTSNEFQRIKNPFIFIARLEKLRLSDLIVKQYQNLKQKEILNFTEYQIKVITTIALFHLLDDGFFPYSLSPIKDILIAIPADLQQTLLADVLALCQEMDEDYQEDYVRIREVIKPYLKSE